MTETMYEMCECGHFGGHSPNNVHEPNFSQGHGACIRCNCKQFTWVGYCDSNGKIQ